MSKSTGGHFKGTSGAKKAGDASNGTPPLFENGHITKEGIEAHKEESADMTVEEFVELLQKNGYEVHTRPSKHEKKGSKAVIIEVDNPSKQRNIRQVQVSPGGGRHGKDPYVKISTGDQGRNKVIKGSPDDYKGGENEKAHVIFTEEAKK